MKHPLPRGSCVDSFVSSWWSYWGWLDHKGANLINGLIHWWVHSWTGYWEAGPSWKKRVTRNVPSKVVFFPGHTHHTHFLSLFHKMSLFLCHAFSVLLYYLTKDPETMKLSEHWNLWHCEPKINLSSSKLFFSYFITVMECWKHYPNESTCTQFSEVFYEWD
jgi:hypothetical protein